MYWNTDTDTDWKTRTVFTTATSLTYIILILSVEHKRRTGRYYMNRTGSVYKKHQQKRPNQNIRQKAPLAVAQTTTFAVTNVARR